MKVILIAAIAAIVILITSTYLFSQMSECMYPSVGTNRISYDFGFCWELLVNGHLPYSSEPEPQSLQARFETIKESIEKTGYDICDIRLDENKVIVDLHKFFEGTEQEQKIISKIPSTTNYEIVYHEGYSDYFINTKTTHKCGELIED